MLDQEVDKENATPTTARSMANTQRGQYGPHVPFHVGEVLKLEAGPARHLNTEDKLARYSAIPPTNENATPTCAL